MITLITGVPGTGKTALTVQLLLSEYSDRPLYVSGIPKLVVPHIHLKYDEVLEMHKGCEIIETEDGIEHSEPKYFEPNSVIVIDECQKIFPPRTPSKKPHDFVKFLEIHRHFGLDLIVITQKPSLLDKNVRELVSRHIHLRSTSFGRYLYEWPETQENPLSKSARSEAARTKFKLSKDTLQAYESATSHTKIKRRVPVMVLVLPFAVISALSLWGWFFYDKSTQNQQQLADTINHEPEQSFNQLPASNNKPFKTGFTLIKSLLPENYDYSNVKACILSSSRCYCYDLGAAQLNIEYHVCKAIVNYGLPNRSYPVPPPPVVEPVPDTPKNNIEYDYDDIVLTDKKKNI